MSVEAVERKSGRVWRVRWRDETGTPRSRVVGRKQDAVQYDSELKRRKRLGDLDLYTRGHETLAEFAPEWWQRHVKPNLADRTIEKYAGMWALHILPLLGSRPLREITADVIQTWMADLRASGVGETSVKRSVVILSGMLTKAFEWGRIPSNPALKIRKPRAPRKRFVRPLSVDEINALMAFVPTDMDQAIIGFLAYGGLRPSELLVLQWSDIRNGSMLVDKAMAPDGSVKETKTNQTRKVRIRPELQDGLDRWSLAGPNVVYTKDGGQFTDSLWNAWRLRVWKPAAHAVGVDARPYDLRHTFVSRMIEEGASIIDVARQAGHSPAVALNVYGHLFE